MKPSSFLAVLLLPPSSSHLPSLIHAANATAAVAGREDAARVASDPRRPLPSVAGDASTSGVAGEAETCRAEGTPPRGAKEEAAASSRLLPSAPSGTPRPLNLNGVVTAEEGSDADEESGRPPTTAVATGDDGDYEYVLEYSDDVVDDSDNYDHGNIFDSDYQYDESSGKPPTIAQMSRMRNCHTLPTVGRPLYAEEDWRRLREIYRQQGGRAIKFQAEVAEGFVPPMRSGQTTDGKGRGVFAARDIQKGEMTYGGVDHYAYFNDGPSYRNFVAALSDHEACDVLTWTWTAPWGPVILLLLDDNALQNGAEDPGEANTGSQPELSNDITRMFEEYALRDIAKGEELLCDYSLFADEFWAHFGL